MGSLCSLQGSLVPYQFAAPLLRKLGGCIDHEEVGLLTEIENYLQRMDDLRNQIEVLAAKVKPDDLNWRPFISEGEEVSNSFAVLVAHVCGAEHFWIAEIIGGRPPTRDRKAEFAIQTDSHTDLFNLLHQNSKETREILSALTPEDLDGSRLVDGKSVPVRWAILHVVDHTSLHLGHMQMTYQILSGGKANPSPLWSERVP